MRLVAVTPLIEVPGFAVPKSTAVAPVKLVPVTVTEVPPAAGPLEGLTPVTVGRPGVVGELVTRRVDRRGAVGGGHRDVDRAGRRRGGDREAGGGAPVIGAGVVPKSTAVAPVKLVPVTVTEVPPAAGPLEGLTPVTVGSAGAL